jgi:pimeloyl-ACP methyl ester carboxylesterase
MALVLEGDGYIEAGSGLPVVMMPGMEGSKWFWAHQVDALSEECRAVSCDLAIRNPRLASTMADYAARTLQIMDSLGIEKAVLIGESMGGMITQEIALSHPERVAGVVLCNTMDRPRPGAFGLNVFTLATLVHQLAFLPFLSDGQRRSILRWVGRHRGFVMDPTPGNEDLIDYLFAHGLDCGGPAFFDRMIAASKIRYTKRLCEIEVPALVLRGTEDRLIGAETILQIAGRLPNARLVLVDGGGHCCTNTMPEESTRLIREWLVDSGLL